VVPPLPPPLPVLLPRPVALETPMIPEADTRRPTGWELTASVADASRVRRARPRCRTLAG